MTFVVLRDARILRVYTARQRRVRPSALQPSWLADDVDGPPQRALRRATSTSVSTGGDGSPPCPNSASHNGKGASMNRRDTMDGCTSGHTAATAPISRGQP